jgi:hypothetical protein
MSNDQSVLPRTIGALAQAARPSFALLAGMALDLSRPLVYAADPVVAWNA